MIAKDSNGKLQVNTVSLNLFFGDMFLKCDNVRQVEWLHNNLVSAVELAADERLEELKYDE